MRTRARVEDLANGGRSRGSAAVRGTDGADGWGIPVSVPQREGRGRGSDERDPPVSDPQREERGGQRAQRPRGPSRGGPACGPISGRSLQQFFFFFLCSFCFIFEFV